MTRDVSALLYDLRYALRLLARAPGFTAAVVAVLALGIGANSAMFSVLNGAILHAIPYFEPDRIVSVMEQPQARAASDPALHR